MARSRNKTCLAILREKLGSWGKEAAFAAVINRSTSWVKHASAGLIRIPRETAIQIGFKTGVCPEWLARNDTAKPPVTADTGAAYDQAYFIQYKEMLDRSKPYMSDPLLPVATQRLPELFLKITAAVHDICATTGNVNAASNLFASLADRVEAYTCGLPVKKSDDFTSDLAHVDFCRLALRSSLALLRTGPEKKSSSEPHSTL